MFRALGAEPPPGYADSFDLVERGWTRYGPAPERFVSFIHSPPAQVLTGALVFGLGLGIGVLFGRRLSS